MIPLNEWIECRLLITFIVGHQYIVVASAFRSFEDVFENVRQFAIDSGGGEGNGGPTVPFVLLNNHLCREENIDLLRDNGMIDIDLS